jgi:hypothetical protein
MFKVFKKPEVADFTPIMRRLVDVTTPNVSMVEEMRMERRYNRTLPVMVAPSVKGRPDGNALSHAVSHDFSDRGLAIISSTPLSGEEFFVSVWPMSKAFDEPLHLKCALCSCHPISTVFWSCGFSVLEIMNLHQRTVVASLDAIARKTLRPEA